MERSCTSWIQGGSLLPLPSRGYLRGRLQGFVLSEIQAFWTGPIQTQYPTQNSLSPWGAPQVSWHEMLRTLWKEFHRQKYRAGTTDISIWSAKSVRLETLSTEETPKFCMFFFRKRNFRVFSFKLQHIQTGNWWGRINIRATSPVLQQHYSHNDFSLKYF